MRYARTDLYRQMQEGDELIKRLQQFGKYERYGTTDQAAIKQLQKEEFDELKRQRQSVLRKKQEDAVLQESLDDVLEQIFLEGKIEEQLRAQGVRDEVIATLPQLGRLTTGVPAPMISQQPLTDINGRVVADALEKRILTQDHKVRHTDDSFVTYMLDPNTPGAPLVANLVDSVITPSATRASLYGVGSDGLPMPGNEHVAQVGLKAATRRPVDFEPHGQGGVDFAGIIDGTEQSIDAQVRPFNDDERGVLRSQLVTSGQVPGMINSRDMQRELDLSIKEFVASKKSQVSPNTVLGAMVYNNKLNSNWDDQYHIGKAYKYDNVLYSTVPDAIARTNEKQHGFPLAQAYDALHMLNQSNIGLSSPIGKRKMITKPNSGRMSNQTGRVQIDLQVPETNAIDMINTPKYAHASQLLRRLPYA